MPKYSSHLESEGTTYDFEQFEISGQSDSYRWNIHSFDDGSSPRNIRKRDGSKSLISVGPFSWSGSSSSAAMAVGAISSYVSISTNTTFTTNQTWSQNYQVANNLTITLETTSDLTMDPSITVMMESNSTDIISLFLRVGMPASSSFHRT